MPTWRHEQGGLHCHGNLSKVGAATRQGWLDVPACQMCHTGGGRYLTTFDSTGNWRVTGDTTFATNPNKPASGKTLFRFSSGHGALYCSGCHGSQHAEYPTLQPNDNLYSTNLQAHTGKIVECTVCHTTVPLTQTGGPHGMHNIDQSWVTQHHQFADNGRVYSVCILPRREPYRYGLVSHRGNAHVLGGRRGFKDVLSRASRSAVMTAIMGPMGVSFAEWMSSRLRTVRASSDRRSYI